MKLKMGPTGIWLSEGGHRCDPGLAEALVTFFGSRGGDVVDVGCGDGAYTISLRTAGIDCDGYDGNPLTPQITGGLCGVLDFTQPVNLGAPYNWVLCLEVGEHIPQMYEAMFILNLDKLNTRGIVLSWAVPGQGGAGHVNERSNEYVKGLFQALGYTNNLYAETALRACVTDYCFWFRESLMVFEKS